MGKWAVTGRYTRSCLRNMVAFGNGLPMKVRRGRPGVRILACFLPVKGPWLNPIEPKWTHAKRRIVEPDATLSKQELADRVCATFDCTHESISLFPKMFLDLALVPQPRHMGRGNHMNL